MKSICLAVCVVGAFALPASSKELAIGSFYLGMQGSEATALMTKLLEGLNEGRNERFVMQFLDGDLGISTEVEIKGWDAHEAAAFSGYDAGVRAALAPGDTTMVEYTSPLTGNKVASVFQDKNLQPGMLQRNLTAHKTELRNLYGPPSYEGSHRMAWIYSGGQLLPGREEHVELSAQCRNAALDILDGDNAHQAAELLSRLDCDQVIIFQMTSATVSNHLQHTEDAVVRITSYMVDAEALLSDHQARQ